MSEKAMEGQSKSIAKGISVLGVTGVLCKFVGVLYSIPLARILKPEGLGLFQTVFPTYNLFLTISSAGLPVAVSRMVAHYLAQKDPANARKTFSVALMLLGCVGFFFSFIMLLSNQLLTRLVGVEEAAKGFVAIAPCVLIVCILSAFRGYIQGHQNMLPTAISQMIEQIGKVAVSLPLAAVGMNRGIEYGAAGALWGITLVEIAALVYMIVLYAVHRKKHPLTAPPASPVTQRSLARQLVEISVPITVSACIIPLSQFIDSALMVNRMVDAGLSRGTATSLYGIFSGMVIRLINIPTALALAISMSLVPAVSAAKAIGSRENIIRETNTGLRYAALIGFPCSIGMSILAKPILQIFYTGTLTPERMQTAAELLQISALTVFLFTMVQASSSILQGLHHQSIPMYAMIAGVSLKILLNYTLIGTPGIDIHGGPIASIVCYSTALIPNLIYCCKYAEIRCRWMDWFIRPGLAALGMGLAVYGLKVILPESFLSTLIMIAAGICVYLGLAWMDHAVDRNDLQGILSFRGRRNS